MSRIPNETVLRARCKPLWFSLFMKQCALLGHTLHRTADHPDRRILFGWAYKPRMWTLRKSKLFLHKISKFINLASCVTKMFTILTNLDNWQSYVSRISQSVPKICDFTDLYYHCDKSQVSEFHKIGDHMRRRKRSYPSFFLRHRKLPKIPSSSLRSKNRKEWKNPKLFIQCTSSNIWYSST